MCTVSWLHTHDGYEIFCNRDEKRTRAQAYSPRVGERAGSRFLAPVDGDRGGSWISVNDHGLSLCLLNAPGARAGSRSRGLLLLDLAAARSALAIRERVAGLDLAPYSGFTLAAFEPHQSPLVIHWNGEVATIRHQPDVPLISSSFDLDRVRYRRLQHYRQIAGAHPTTESLLRFHASHGPARGPYSTCMHRTDAETVSFSRIRVTTREVRLTYSAAPPCRTKQCSSHWLSLRS